MRNVASKPVPRLHQVVRRASGTPHSPGKRVVWDLAIGVAGVAYLVVVLFAGYYSPIFGVALIVLFAYELLEPHFRRRRPTSDSPTVFVGKSHP